MSPIAAAPMRPSENCRPWKIAASPSVLGASLSGVSATAADDVWAVGDTDVNRPIIEHWDGSRWGLVRPAPGPFDVTLADVVAISRTDAWAVGDSSDLFAQHWDGSAWTLVPMPPPEGYVYGVDATESDDVWAVGSFTDETGIHPLVRHWDGTGWQTVPAPDGTRTSTNVLIEVSAVSLDDAWAVGYQDVTGGANFQPLVEHWNGVDWTVVPSPDLPGDNNQLYSVSAVSATDAWAVGFSGPDPLVQRWNGIEWILQEPAPGPGVSNAFYAVDAFSRSDVWAVGAWAPPQVDYFPLSEHWNGRQWSLADTPYPGRDANLHAVEAISSRDIWAVGAYFDVQGLKPLILRSTGRCR